MVPTPAYLPPKLSASVDEMNHLLSVGFAIITQLLSSLSKSFPSSRGVTAPRWALDMHLRQPPPHGSLQRVRVVMLSVLGGDVQALLFLTVSGTEGKVKKNFTSFYSIFHPLTPLVTCRQGRFRPCPHIMFLVLRGTNRSIFWRC